MQDTQTPTQTTAPEKPAEKSPQKPGQYSIARPEGKCHLCARPIAAGEKLLTALRETSTSLERLDICSNCRPNFDTTGLLGFWQTTMQPQSARKKIFLDDDVLCDLFARLADTTEPAKLNFRFVLGLILMRKRRIVYDSTRHDGETEIWAVHFKGREESMDLVNPRLGEQQVAEVSAQLGEILSTDL